MAEIIYTLFIDTGGQSINTVEVRLDFDPRSLQVLSTDDTGSVIPLWPKPVSFSNKEGTINIEGVVPGGYAGASGKILEIRAKSLSQGIPDISISKANALLNDGKGTLSEARFAITHTNKVANLNVQTASSSASPAFIFPKIGSDPQLFGGKYFIAFAANGQVAAINHYDVAEVPAGDSDDGPIQWRVAESPYALKDQSLRSNIFIRAIDADGNTTVAEIPAPNYRADKYTSDGSYVFIGIAVLLLAIYVLRRNRKLEKP
ncbi:MAG: hypothetical protein V1489_02795 [Candidatus Liptonbacteria bacterium]